GITTRKPARSGTPATGQIPTAQRCLIPGRAKYRLGCYWPNDNADVPGRLQRHDATKTQRAAPVRSSAWLTRHAAAAARQRQGTGQSGQSVVEACQQAVVVVPKEIGAPASRIRVALGANALTPRHKDLPSRYLGPGSHHHGKVLS